MARRMAKRTGCRRRPASVPCCLAPSPAEPLALVVPADAATPPQPSNRGGSAVSTSPSTRAQCSATALAVATPARGSTDRSNRASGLVQAAGRASSGHKAACSTPPDAARLAAIPGAPATGSQASATVAARPAASMAPGARDSAAAPISSRRNRAPACVGSATCPARAPATAVGGMEPVPHRPASVAHMRAPAHPSSGLHGSEDKEPSQSRHDWCRSAARAAQAAEAAPRSHGRHEAVGSLPAGGAAPSSAAWRRHDASSAARRLAATATRASIASRSAMRGPASAAPAGTGSPAESMPGSEATATRAAVLCGTSPCSAGHAAAHPVVWSWPRSRNRRWWIPHAPAASIARVRAAGGASTSCRARPPSLSWASRCDRPAMAWQITSRLDKAPLRRPDATAARLQGCHALPSAPAFDARAASAASAHSRHSSAARAALDAAARAGSTPAATSTRASSGSRPQSSDRHRSAGRPTHAATPSRASRPGRAEATSPRNSATASRAASCACHGDPRRPAMGDGVRRSLDDGPPTSSAKLD
mmetsp:Transcript_18239/g.69010  ORF Transcript_18239/g.69010 Transcript_18239/m.69010 type:complete len:535 (+) Transcript_18239:1145-2749(+)